MSYCKISILLAYAMAIYTLASIYYYIRTRSVGTPFKDSLTEKQIEIKKESVKVRSNIFYQGIGLSLISLAMFRPFEKC
tara:strand:+ start:825 stop:1061 length:237 start_codon:yes stop_codon:yes gene_type:complete